MKAGNRQTDSSEAESSWAAGGLVDVNISWLTLSPVRWKSICLVWGRRINPLVSHPFSAPSSWLNFPEEKVLSVFSPQSTLLLIYDLALSWPESLGSTIHHGRDNGERLKERWPPAGRNKSLIWCGGCQPQKIRWRQTNAPFMTRNMDTPRVLSR